MDDCKSYFLETGRRVSFEYTLLAGINDEKEHAEELAELLRMCGGGYHVNLIPYNPIEGSEYKRPYRKVVQAFVDALEARKITVSVRRTRGLDANVACSSSSPTPTAAPPPQQPMADAAADLRRRMKEQHSAIQRRFIDSRNWAAAASPAFSAALLEARSIANQTVSN
uniref:Radical SAM core domain-containing protein n=1 Tax=Zea mays TaxID=4577 RepID=A0A804N6M1_MAIZE